MIYITGANGQLGRDLTRVLQENNVEHRAFSRQDWDVFDEITGRSLMADGGCRVIVNCAAYTAVDAAESDRDAAFRLNGEAPAILRKLAYEYGAFLIHISTDFVFSDVKFQDSPLPRPWKVEDPVSPEGVYAESKWAGEESIRHLNRELGLPEYGGTTIIRTSWVYTSHGKNFPLTMLRLGGDPSREKLTIIEDQLGRPTWAYRIAQFIFFYLQFAGILKNNDGWSCVSDPSQVVGELIHFSNEGVASWYDFALATLDIAREQGKIQRTTPVIPIPTEDYPTPAPRPRYSVLDLARARQIMPDIPHWRDDLRVMLQETDE